MPGKPARSMLQCPAPIESERHVFSRQHPRAAEDLQLKRPPQHVRSNALIVRESRAFVRAGTATSSAAGFPAWRSSTLDAAPPHHRRLGGAKRES